MENGKDTALFDLRNQIYCTDCMELMAHIPDGFVSLILTDPPYGISYQNHFARQPHKRLDGDCGIDYERFAWESYRILRDNSHAYFFTRFDCYPYHYDCLQKAGFTVKNCLVVEKGAVGGIGDLKGSFAINAEWVIFCQKGRRIFQQTQLLENRYKEGTQFHKGREPSKRYKTRFPACWFGAEYPKVLQLSEKGYLKSNVVKGDRFADKAVYSITDKGRKYFNELMSTYASESIPLLFDFNVVITNLNKVSKDEALKLISKLRTSIQSSALSSEQYAAEFSDIPLVGKTIFEQQRLLYHALLDWLDNYESQFSQE